jgi:hypothetical protein
MLLETKHHSEKEVDPEVNLYKAIYSQKMEKMEKLNISSSLK